MVFKDGERVDEARWGAKVAVDPGEHTFVAEAPGKQRYTSKVLIVDAATTVVAIPALLDAPAEAPRNPNTEATAPSAGTRTESASRVTPHPTGNDNASLRRWSVILAGVGFASVGTGLALNLTTPDSPDGCTGACAAGTGLMIGGALFTAAGIAFFLASFGQPSSRVANTVRPFALEF